MGGEVLPHRQDLTLAGALRPDDNALDQRDPGRIPRSEPDADRSQSVGSVLQNSTRYHLPRVGDRLFPGPRPFRRLMSPKAPAPSWPEPLHRRRETWMLHEYPRRKEDGAVDRPPGPAG